uniref:Uncharacterized protein n=1 Tax=Oryza brachyantha TaxID=4533 RepID=J3MS87_ORYBR
MPAAAVERHAERRKQEQPAGDLEHGGQLEMAPTVREARPCKPGGGAADQRRVAPDDGTGSEYDQQHNDQYLAGDTLLVDDRVARHRLGFLHGYRTSASSSSGGHDQMRQCLITASLKLWIVLDLDLAWLDNGKRRYLFYVYLAPSKVYNQPTDTKQSMLKNLLSKKNCMSYTYMDKLSLVLLPRSRLKLQPYQVHFNLAK